MLRFTVVRYHAYVRKPDQQDIFDRKHYEVTQRCMMCKSFTFLIFLKRLKVKREISKSGLSQLIVHALRPALHDGDGVKLPLAF